MVAIKTLKTELPGPLDAMTSAQLPPVPASWQANFKAEAILMSTLKHKNVLRSYGMVDASDEKLRLVQEYAAGGDLLQRIRRPKYTVPEALGWLLGVAKGMRYLHDCVGTGTIAHRDLTPENILLDTNGVAKVADFGLFRMQVELKRQTSGLRHGQSEEEHNAHNFTGDTGSPRYMAPEVFAHQAYGSKVDVFSFAIVAYEVLSRSRAYEHSHLSIGQIPAAVHRSPSFLPKLPKEWHPEVSDLFRSMWAADAEERPGFKEIVAKLCSWHELAVAPLPPGVPPPHLIESLEKPVKSGCCTVC